MTFKKIIGKIHLWLGFTSGLVVFLVCLSGAIMVFEHEIRWLIGTSAMGKTVEFRDLPAVKPSVVFKKALAESDSGGDYIYYSTGKSPQHVLINWYYHSGDSLRNISKGYREIHQNPYTGNVLFNQSWEGGFWGWMVKFHTTLLFPTEIGHQMVGWSTVIFIIMLTTGLILWWPKNQKAKKQRFWFRWKSSTKWKRKNYDFHNILGFYALFFVLIIGLTGLVWSFEWFRNSAYKLVSGGEEMPAFERYTSDYNPAYFQSVEELDFLVDSLTNHVITTSDDVYRYSVGYPLDSLGVINVAVFTNKGKLYDRHNEFVFDRYTGDLLEEEYWADHNGGDRLMHLVYPIHLGLIGGLSTKILAFLVSLIGASLPVTGFLIWWGRKKKSKK